MGYEESVIIPLEIYNKTCFKSNKNKAESLLKREDLPTDVNIKLFDQTRWQQTRKKEEESTKTFPQYALDQIPIGVQPFIRSIIDQYISKNRKVIDWDPQTFELILDGLRRPGSNIIRSFQNLLQGKEDNLQEKLSEIGVPDEWLSQKLGVKSDPGIASSSMDTSRKPEDLTPYKSHLSDGSLISPVSWNISNPVANRTRTKTTPKVWKTRKSTRIIKKTKWSPYL